MKLFVITSRIPYPLDKGDKLRVYHQMKTLSKEHDIYLCALQLPFSKPPTLAQQELGSFCKEVHFIKLPFLQILLSLALTFFNKHPFQTAFFTTISAKKKVQNLIKIIRPQHIYCQLTRAAEYVRTEDIPKTLDYMDVFSKGMERRAEKAPFISKWLYNWEATKQKKYESQLFDEFDTHTIITEEDRNFIDHPNKLKVNIIRNGVDFEFFAPQKSTNKYDLVFVGNMGYAPNIDAAKFLCNEILPIIREQRPHTSVLIAGTNPPQSIQKLASAKTSITGWMQDIRDAYAQSTLFIAPMRIGTGLQNKILEAMAMNKPCVTTSLASKPIKAPNEALYVGDSKEALATHCLNLLKNQDLRNQLSSTGNQFVRENYKWEKTSESLNKLFFSN